MTALTGCSHPSSTVKTVDPNGHATSITTLSVMTFFEATSSLTKKYSGTSGTGILPRRVGLSIGVALGHSLARSHFIDFVYRYSHLCRPDVGFW
jgi:hypothetical protein